LAIVLSMLTKIGLKNAVETTFGAGALDKINAMQMLHSVYRLQESLDLDEWRYVLHKSSQFVADYNPTIVDTMTPTNAKERNLLQFYRSYNTVLSFHSKFKKVVADPSSEYKGTILAKMQQPILTRWWTVGSAASYEFDYYLVIYHACQTIINIYKSDRTPHAIASDLFAMLSDQENFIDMTLIRCYNKACLNPHLDWLQSSKDLTNHEGFQAHHIATRFYIMDKGIRSIMMTGRLMEDYHEAVAKWSGPEETLAIDRERHNKKLRVFLEAAHALLQKHFRRWLSRKLLPAALLSEAPIAKVVAATILGRELPNFASDPSVKDDRRLSGFIKYKSTVHKEDIYLCQFNKWLREQLKDIDGEYTQESISASTLLLDDGMDLRVIEYENGIHGAWRWFMHSTYLPLPHQTQFIESAVKEAKNVSATDRSEQIRTCMAVIRSATPLGKEKDEANKRKILSIIESARARTEPHQDWIRAQVDSKCDQRFNTLLCALARQGHFKNERIEAKMLVVDDQGAQFKRQNKNQQAKQQHMTSAVTGLLPYTKVTKKRNMDDVLEEIQCRLWQLNYQTPIPHTMPLRKDLLHRLETIRLIEEEGLTVDKATAHKSFLQQSEAEFKLTDD